jgi:pSer/pThr/pTyr-binding forkhead associated (FHA) protein
MLARLISLHGQADITIDRVFIVVGRHRGCDVRLDSSRISRRHCCLALDAGEVVVRDLGSTNGTRINGARIDSGILRPGDELSIAHFTYRLITSEPNDNAPTTMSPTSRSHALPTNEDQTM